MWSLCAKAAPAHKPSLWLSAKQGKSVCPRGNIWRSVCVSFKWNKSIGQQVEYTEHDQLTIVDCECGGQNWNILKCIETHWKTHRKTSKYIEKTVSFGRIRQWKQHIQCKRWNTMIVACIVCMVGLVRSLATRVVSTCIHLYPPYLWRVPTGHFCTVEPRMHQPKQTYWEQVPNVISVDFPKCK